MRILSKMILATFALSLPIGMIACNDEDGNKDGAGGADGNDGDDDGSSTGGRTGAGGGDGTGATTGSGGGTGGSDPVIPEEECKAYPDLFCVSDCRSTEDGKGPHQRVLDTGAAFAESKTWMDGWTNWLDNSSGIGKVKVTDTISADITDDTTWTADKVYLIKGVIHVTEGAELTIEPGTIIIGEEFSGGTLVISRGSKIHAVGTKEEPIIFTSEFPDGAKARGQFGGLVVLGNASNFKSANMLVDGLAASVLNQHGPGGPAGDSGLSASDTTNDGESSGEIKYVRIEFGGTEIADGKEVNGLTLGSVGSGTEISYVQVNTTLDDCFEWFGGTVDADHLVCNNEGDDMFDTDAGWRGTIDTFFGRQMVTTKSDPNGFEWDSDLTDQTPVTHATAKNGTVCGTGEIGNPNFGAVLREKITGAIENVDFVGFDAGFDARDAFGTETAPNVTLEKVRVWASVDGEVAYDDETITNDTACQTGTTPWLCDDDVGFDEREWFSEGTDNSYIQPAD